VFHALGDGGGVHDAEVLVAHLLEGEFAVEFGVGVFLGVFAEDAIDAGRFHENVGVEFEGFLGGGGVGGDKRGAGAAGEDYDAAFFEMTFGAAADVGFGDAVHFDGAREACFATERFEGVLQREAINDGGEHAHVVGGGFLDAGIAGGELGPAENVAAADDDRDLYALLLRAVGLFGDVDDLLHADPAFAGWSKAFAGELEDDSPVGAGRSFCRSVGHEEDCGTVDYETIVLFAQKSPEQNCSGLGG